MTIGQYNSRTTSRQAGFSMLDVLVAIVVLATGLLALAALQGAMTRNGVDSRARSQIGAYTQSVIERMRFLGYDLAAPSTLFAQGDTITPASTCQDGSVTTLTALQRLQSDAKCVQSAAGVSNLTTTVTTAQLYCGTSGSTFAAASACTPDQASYKQLKLTSTWTDSTGASRSLSFDTTLSQVTATPTNNALTSANFSPGLGSTPVVREANPGKTLGVIPIAVVTGSSDSAATNPKPVVSNTGTTFSTLTYAASNADLTTITQRVDTKVLQCSCKFGGAVTNDSSLLQSGVLKQPYGPTYWDGTHYVSPAKAKITGNSNNSATGIDTSATQDASCDICCRDRNDVIAGASLGNVDAAGNAVLFDNYTGDTSKYNYSSGALTSVTSGNFVQACRMIRIDGTYMAATDAHLNFFGLLATNNCAAETTPAPTGCTSALDASDTVPSSTVETSYSDFVKKYLYLNFNNLTSAGVPTITESSPQLNDTYGNLYKGSPYNLNLPTNIDITLPNTISRWVYGRGVYIDHLEALARTALSNAIANCGSNTESAVEDCALPILPFTTINMTELGNWSTSNTAVIHVSNTAIIGGDETSPKRGNVTVTSGQDGSTSPTANAIATTYVTNSGLTAVSTNQANSLYDHNAGTNVDHTVTDQRQFTVKSSSGSSGGNPFYFKVVLTGLTQTANITSSNLMPQVNWVGTAAQLGTAATGSTNAYLSGGSWQYAGASATVPIPVATTFTTTPSAIGYTVNVQGFNYSDLTGSESNVPCKQGNSVKTTLSFSGARKCYNYSVKAGNITITYGATNSTVNAGVTAANVTLLSGTTDGKVDSTQASTAREGASILIPASPGIADTTNTLALADLITIPFQLDGTTIAAGTCDCDNGQCGNPTYTPAAESKCP